MGIVFDLRSEENVNTDLTLLLDLSLKLKDVRRVLRPVIIIDRRITLALDAHSIVSHKLIPIVIGKSNASQAFLFKLLDIRIVTAAILARAER